MLRCVLFLLLAAWTTVVAAAPQVVMSMMSQLPPVARVGDKFAFDILPGSYKSSNASITYSATGLPAWLSFSPNVTSFYGTPQAADVGSVNVTFTATDSTGSTTDTAVLIVSNQAAPTVEQSFAAQILDESSRQFASATAMPGGNGVTVPPYWSFSLGWSGSTFKSSSRLYYSAHLKGNTSTSLPSWLEFSNTTFTFNGVAPAGGVYPVVVTATDYWGYTAAETEFVLAVGDGQAVETNATQWTPINTVARANISYTIDTSYVTIGGASASASQFTVTPDLSNFQWLSFDKASNTVTGTTPDSYVNGTVDPMSIPVNLASTNTTNTLGYTGFLNLNILPFFFTDFTLPPTTVASGSSFEYNIAPYLLNTNATIAATVVPADAISWLLYYPENHTLVGGAPDNVTYDHLNLSFIGTANGVNATANVFVDITGVEPNTTVSTPAPIPTAAIHHGLSKTKKIIIGVCVGIGGALLLLLALIFLLCCRRSRSERRLDEKVANYDDSTTPSNRTTLMGAGSRSTPGRPPAFTPDTLKGSPAVKSIADSEATVYGTPGTPTSKIKPAVEESSPRRVDMLNGLFGPADIEDAEHIVSQPDFGIHRDTSASFIGQPDVIAVSDPVRRQPSQPETTRSATSAGSLASWESQDSFHWSGEDVYLPPLVGAGSTSGVSHMESPTVESGHPAVTPTDANIPRPKPGFYPRFPRKVKPGDPTPFMSSDDVTASYSQFSEFQRDMSTRSLDSFQDSGSALGSARFGSNNTFMSRFASGDNSGSNSSALARFTSSNLTYSSNDEQAIVATAERRSVDVQRTSVAGVIDFTAPPEPEDRPVSRVLAGPVIPNLAPPPPRRRASSSRKTSVHLHATRDNIVGPGPNSPIPLTPEAEQLATFSPQQQPELYDRHYR